MSFVGVSSYICMTVCLRVTRLGCDIVIGSNRRAPWQSHHSASTMALLSHNIHDNHNNKDMKDSKMNVLLIMFSLDCFIDHEKSICHLLPSQNGCVS